ncbi:MAG: adenine deaminase [Planctomycetota bacterium]
MNEPQSIQRRLEVARGDAPADLILRGARVLDVFQAEFFVADIAIRDGVIAGVGQYDRAESVIDVAGRVVTPGLIDAHMHVESTMLRPSVFAPLALSKGTTGGVLDPHEIANVLGIDGIRWIMDDAETVPGRWVFAASSCVPASPHETSGARLEAEDLAHLFDDPRVVALAELMNFPGAIAGDPGLLAKLRLGLERRGVVDGHAPGLSGRSLQAYVGAGVSSDHECTTADEAREKLRAGQMVYIREGSAARNLEALLPAVTDHNWWRFGFCTDDRHPDDLADDGHMDHVVRRAITLGLDPARAIAMASHTTARHYGWRRVGAVAPGFEADLVVFDDERSLRAKQVLVAGRLVASNGQSEITPAAAPNPPRLAESVRLRPAFDEAALRIPAGPSRVRVIGMLEGQLLTERQIEAPSVQGDQMVADPTRDLLKLAVIERHGKAAADQTGVGLGFVRGFGLRRGALATTVGHDSHNIAVVGACDADMVVAARELGRLGGGLCAVAEGNVLASLPLPIAGLMSDRPADEVIETYRSVLDAAATLGAAQRDPFMPLSFLPLTVIPHLKLGDRGLVDVDRFEIVPLAADAPGGVY